jgi:hypothetical protein
MNHPYNRWIRRPCIWRKRIFQNVEYSYGSGHGRILFEGIYAILLSSIHCKLWLRNTSQEIAIPSVGTFHFSVWCSCDTKRGNSIFYLIYLSTYLPTYRYANWRRTNLQRPNLRYPNLRFPNEAQSILV